MAQIDFNIVSQDVSPAGKAKSIRHIIDRVNFCHFQDKRILLVFKHKTLNRLKTVKAAVCPCDGSELVCKINEDFFYSRIFAKYEIHKVILSFTQKSLELTPKYTCIQKDFIHIGLPDTCIEVQVAEPHMNSFVNIEAKLISEQAIYKAIPLQFSSTIIKVLIPLDEHRKQLWTFQKNSVVLLLYSGNQNYFSGQCEIYNENECDDGILLLLTIPNTPYARYNKRKFRSQRVQILPTPDIVFCHPFTKEYLSFKLYDISGRGFSFDVPSHLNCFFPRLTIPNVEVRFGLEYSVTTKIQIVYAQAHTSGQRSVRYGACFVDIDFDSVTKILYLLHQVQDDNLYLASPFVDTRKLWQFFFESGFIYPHKYYQLSQRKDDIKSLYEKLYSGSPYILKQFTYQMSGEILAHISMVRLFDQTWLIHHHAADRINSTMSGIKVLSQISHYVNEVHHFQDANMEKVMCFYRPDNKFPSRVFGGVAKRLNDKKKCSIDSFCYLLSIKDTPEKDYIQDCIIEEAFDDDLDDFYHIYANLSDGLLTSAFNFRESNALVRSYEDYEMTRKLKSYVIRIGRDTVALALVIQSNLALNLSNLTNCIYFFCLDEKQLNQNLIACAIKDISQLENANDLSVMLYPSNVIDDLGIEYDKKYMLWILDLEYLDDYFQYCTRLFRQF